MTVCRPVEWRSVVNESAVLIMFVTVDGERTIRNILKRHKIV